MAGAGLLKSGFDEHFCNSIGVKGSGFGGGRVTGVWNNSHLLQYKHDRDANDDLHNFLDERTDAKHCVSDQSHQYSRSLVNGHMFFMQFTTEKLLNLGIY